MAYLGRALKLYTANVSALPFLLQRCVGQSIHQSVGLLACAKRFESWHWFCCCFFLEILLTSGFRMVQNSLKKKEATGYFSCHKVTSHTEEMNNIRKTDPGYQKSSVS